MPVSYDRLWKVLIDKKLTKTDLKKLFSNEALKGKKTRKAPGFVFEDDSQPANNTVVEQTNTTQDVVEETVTNAVSGEIEGVNKASVFLTNGPIDYKNNVLPSIEFGLGAGVEIEWEAI